MKIVLTPIEIAAAANIGVLRRVSSIQKGLNPRMLYAPEQDRWQKDIEGACAEYACAKGLGIHWGAGINTFKLADIGDRIQVRSTTRKDGCLIIRDIDRSDHFYILLTGLAPEYKMVGWMMGKEAKDKKWLSDPNNRKPSFFVPQNCLHPIEELRTKAVGF